VKSLEEADGIGRAHKSRTWNQPLKKGVAKMGQHLTLWANIRGLAFFAKVEKYRILKQGEERG